MVSSAHVNRLIDQSMLKTDGLNNAIEVNIDQAVEALQKNRLGAKFGRGAITQIAFKHICR